MRPAAIVFFYYYLTQTQAADRPRPAPTQARATRRAHPRSRRAAIPAPDTLSNPATGSRTP